MKRQNRPSLRESRQVGPSWMQTGPFLAVPGLLIIGQFLPPHLSWGFNWWAELPQVIRWVAPAVAAALLIPGASAVLGQTIGRALISVTEFVERQNRILSGVAGAAVLAAVLFLLRVKCFLFGDGITILESVASGGALSFKAQMALQPLGVVVNDLWFSSLSRFTDLAPDAMLALLSSLGGATALVGMWKISGELGKGGAGRLLVFAFGLTSGVCMLFFGYLENYIWPTAMLLWSLASCLVYVRTKREGLSAIVFAGVGTAFHFVLAPQLVLATVLVWSRGRIFAGGLFGLRAQTAAVMLGGVSVLGGIIAQLALKNDPLVPVWPTAENPYWVLSPRHLADVLNQLVLVSPLALVALTGRLAPARTETAEEGGSGAKLRLVATIAYVFLLTSFWIDPELGAARDWDLLSIYGLPLTLASALWLKSRLRLAETAQMLVVPALALSLVLLLPIWYVMHSPSVALSRLDGLVQADPHYDESYQRAERTLAWATILRKQTDEPQLARKYLERRVAADPGSSAALFSLGELVLETGRADTAEMYFVRAVRADSTDGMAWVKLAHARQQLGRWVEALASSERGVRLSPTNVTAMTTHGIGLCRLDRFDEALVYLRQAYAVAGRTFEQAANLGLAFVGAGRPDSALYYFDVAASLATPERVAPILTQMTALAIQMGDKARADLLYARLRASHAPEALLNRVRGEYRAAFSASPD